MSINYGEINTIVFTCSAGIGASVMGAAIMSKVFKDMGLQVKVEAKAIDSLSQAYDLIVCHIDFKSLLEANVSNSNVVYIDKYLDKDFCIEMGKKIINAKREKK